MSEMPVEVTLPAGSPDIHESGTALSVDDNGCLRVEYRTKGGAGLHNLAIYSPGQWIKARRLDSSVSA